MFEKTPVRYREYSLYKYFFRRFVLKNRLIGKGILAVMLVFGLVFAGCKQQSSEEDKQVIIKINGVSGFDTAMVWVFAEMPSGGGGQQTPVNDAIGYNSNNNGEFTTPLVVPRNNTALTDTFWQGGKDCYVVIIKMEDGSQTKDTWMYTNGQESPVKVSFPEAPTEPIALNFNKFKKNS
ncbi:MAG: hypothetical protein LBK61_10535 [Spirochaetaceae bacterium]|nr:hypothetical protein [Spirochaetaceae bacterium]